LLTNSDLSRFREKDIFMTDIFMTNLELFMNVLEASEDLSANSGNI